MTPELLKKHTLREFEIEAEWKVRHTFQVTATTFEEACEQLEDAVPPYDKLPVGELVDDSFKIVTPNVTLKPIT